ncbi:MAG: hypothetical protein J5I93_21755 [Pirellulaceae bacterium]|nr:hypothetical protein [Pirellulaceae bacterium]
MALSWKPTKTHRTAAGARTLPQRSYLAADVYQLEGEQLFGCHWLCAGRASDLGAEAGPRLVEVE